jgi:hypothetical protein
MKKINLNKILFLMILSNNIYAISDFKQHINHDNVIQKNKNFSTFTTPYNNGDGTYDIDYTGNGIKDFRITYDNFKEINGIELYESTNITHPLYGKIDNLIKIKSKVALSYTYIRDNNILVSEFEGNTPNQELINDSEVNLFGLTYKVLKRQISTEYNTYKIYLTNKINSEVSYVSFNMDENNQIYNIKSFIKSKLKENTIATHENLSFGENLIENGNFVDGTNWKQYDNGSNVGNDLFDGTNTNTLDGSGSIKFTKGDGVHKLHSSKIKIQNDKEYTIGFYMKSEGNPLPNLLFQATHYDKDENYIKNDWHSHRWGNSKANTWEEVFIKIKALPTTEYFILKIQNYDNVEGVDNNIWLDDFYIKLEQLKEDIIPKESFTGTMTNIDNEGNVRTLINGSMEDFFPLCIYSDNYRDLQVYSNQGFNCLAWSSTHTAIQNAKNATSVFNPYGMKAALQIAQYTSVGAFRYNDLTHLQSTLDDIKSNGVEENLLWYYWDNENNYDKWNVPISVVDKVKLFSVEANGDKKHPIYALNGNVGQARKYNDYVDVGGTYIISGILDIANYDNVDNSYLDMNYIEGIKSPIVMAQINLGGNSLTGVKDKMRAVIYKSIILGAKGIGYWRDKSPLNPSYQDGDGNMKSSELHGDITTTSWWEDFKNIRNEIDLMMQNGIIQSPLLKLSTARTNVKNIEAGIRKVGEKYYMLIANLNDESKEVEITINIDNKFFQKAIDFISKDEVSKINSERFKLTLLKGETKIIELQ